MILSRSEREEAWAVLEGIFPIINVKCIFNCLYKTVKPPLGLQISALIQTNVLVLLAKYNLRKNPKDFKQSYLDVRLKILVPLLG